MTRSSGPPRRFPRVEVSASATLVMDDGGEIPVILLDVSNAGFRLRSDELLQAGERVRVRSEEADEFTAEIRWVRGFEAGGEFLDRPPEID